MAKNGACVPRLRFWRLRELAHGLCGFVRADNALISFQKAKDNKAYCIASLQSGHSIDDEQQRNQTRCVALQSQPYSSRETPWQTLRRA